MLENLAYIEDENKTTALPNNSMHWVNNILTSFNYFTYLGSLTASPCSENVSWLIMKKNVEVSSSQVERRKA